MGPHASIAPVGGIIAARESGVHVTKSKDEFEAFFVANYDSVLATVVTVTGDRERAIDATQEAFVKASARWNKIRSYDVPAAWVRRAAINASRDTWRSERRRRRREAQHANDVRPSPAQDVADTATANDLLACLSPRQREVAALFYVEDRSIEETAHILGISQGTVKSQLADARTRLRQHLTTTEASQ